MPEKGKSKNIQIPLTLFKNIITFMECCDITECNDELQKLYRSIFSALIDKQESMDLRNAYSKVVFAKDDEQRKAARTAYLEQKELSNT